MNIEPTSFTIGFAIGVTLIAALNFKTLRRMALSLKHLGVELGIESSDNSEGGGVKMGNVGGDVSGNIAGRDINNSTNFFKNVNAAIKAATINATKGPGETVLVSREHVSVEFPDTPEGQRAKSVARGLAQQKEFFPTDASQRMLLPHVMRFERTGWKVTAIRWSDNGNNGFHVEFTLEKPFDRNA